MKKSLIITGAIVIAIGLLFAYALFRPDSESNSTSDAPAVTQVQPTQGTSSGDAQQASGDYIDYSPGIIEQTSGTKIVYFHANWCPQCRALEADIKANGVPGGVTIIKADFDSSQELRSKYGVTLQTTLVRVGDDGSELEKFVAYQDPSLEAVISNLL